MPRAEAGAPPPPSDAETGHWRGRSVARRFVSPDGFTVLVGRNAADNDLLTFELATPRDFWFHVASGSGSHVVVRNPAGLERLPRATERFAAALAAANSKARSGGQTAVHVTVRGEVRKPRGGPDGTVTLGRSRTVMVSPLRELGSGDRQGDPTGRPEEG
jgi:predicted ribosome quality control (RQC) complex YloA/Tae2 family protein